MAKKLTEKALIKIRYNEQGRINKNNYGFIQNK